jgi:2-methylfumaryl-CoA isomerase
MSGLGRAFDALGVCWAPYQSLEAGLEDPALFHGNPVFRDLKQPSGARYPAAGAAATMLKEPRLAPRPAPRLGQHTDEILAEVLGLSSAEICRLHDQGVVAGAT